MEIPSGIFSSPVKDFWRVRDEQAHAQRAGGDADRGSRSAVTGGRQMDGFLEVITGLLTATGIPRESVYASGRLSELPGFFRATKGWDMVVVVDGVLMAAIELKSQVGPSFGNNFNNRAEEALGTAVDTWTAFREGAFLSSPSPWLGYLFLLEDCNASRAPVRIREPHFKVFKEFSRSSYSVRYELFCRKLVLERQYNAACFITADKQKANFPQNYTEPASDLSVKRFFKSLLGHIAAR